VKEREGKEKRRRESNSKMKKMKENGMMRRG
jgi:hypothetical protein